jgi:hypothetical protein
MNRVLAAALALALCAPVAAHANPVSCMRTRLKAVLRGEQGETAPDSRRRPDLAARDL